MRHMRKLLIATLTIVAACVSPGDPGPASMDEAAFERELERRFQYGPPEPAAQRTEDARAGRIADAAYFAAYPEYERAYTPQARAEAQRLAARLVEDAGELTPDQFTLRVAEIVALADNAHSQVGTAFQKNTRRVPLRTTWFPEGLFVLRAIPAHADLLGARIDTIDGVAAGTVFQRIHHYNGGIETWRRQALTPMLESPGLLHAAGIARTSDALTYAGTLLNGEPFERRVEGEERGQTAPISSTARLIFPTGADAPMQSLLSENDSLPVYLRSRSTLFSLESLPERGLYIGLGFNSDADEETMASFLDRTRTRITAEARAYAVVDLRTNTGGDFTTTYRFATELPSLVEHVYVLTSGWTLSAAMHAAAAIKQSAPDRVTLVGAPVGDRMSFWSEGGAFVLPNAPMIVSYTAGRHNFAGPCNDLDACFWLSALPDRYPVRIPSLDPEIPAPLTFAAYSARRDPGMEAVLAQEASRRSFAHTR